ncbi:unnamed protein product, partial [Closterium sp. NIES-53]
QPLIASRRTVKIVPRASASPSTPSSSPSVSSSSSSPPSLSSLPYTSPHSSSSPPSVTRKSYFDAPLPNLPCWPAPSANAAAFAATGGARRAVQSSAAGTAAGSAESAQQMGTVSVGVDVEEGEEDGGHVGPMMSRQLLRTARGGELSDDEEEVDGSTAIPKIRKAAVSTKLLLFLTRGSSGFAVITPEAEERALAAVRRLKQIAKTRGAAIRVVATSAVREARNRRSFVRRVLDTTGIDVEVLSGQEEACLIYLGILQVRILIYPASPVP